MKNVTDFETLAEFLEHFKDEQTCREHFAAIRFQNGEYCPHCGHSKIYAFNSGKRYRCADCKKDFTIVTGTVFGETKLPLRKWFIAIYLLSTISKGISSIQLAKHVGVTQKTAWFMDHRLRSAMKANKGQLFGTVEADETYVGGSKRNMHKKQSARVLSGRAQNNKIAVLGMKSRGGEVRTQAVKSVTMAALQGAMREHVALGSKLYTDQWIGYRHIVNYIHSTVNHSAREYVRGDVHTNGIESFWALFKRGYHGVYHWMSRKHIQRYLDECAFRLNRRGQKMSDVFGDAVTRVANNPHLYYRELIAAV